MHSILTKLGTAIQFIELSAGLEYEFVFYGKFCKMSVKKYVEEEK